MANSRLGSLIGNLLLMGMMFLLAFGLAEWVVRKLYSDELSLNPRYQTDAWYGDYHLRRIIPGIEYKHTTAGGTFEFRHNNHGFRDEEDIDYAKPEGQTRVLVLGDSHTQGYEVRQDETFAYIIERYLDANGFEAETINTGVSGFGTAEQLALLENEGIRFEPDAVVLGFYGNDFADNVKAGLFALNEAGALEDVKTEHVPGVKIQNFIYKVPFVKWLGENSYFYSLLFNKTWYYYKAQLEKRHGVEQFEYIDPEGDIPPEDIELAIALLERMHSFLAERAIPLVIIDIPQLGGGSSVPESMRQALPRVADAFVDSSVVLQDYLGVLDTHVEYGTKHISALTHTLLGMQAGRELQTLLNAR